MAWRKHIFTSEHLRSGVAGLGNRMGVRAQSTRAYCVCPYSLSLSARGAKWDFFWWIPARKKVNVFNITAMSLQSSFEKKIVHTFWIQYFAHTVLGYFHRLLGILPKVTAYAKHTVCLLESGLQYTQCVLWYSVRKESGLQWMCFAMHGRRWRQLGFVCEREISQCWSSKESALSRSLNPLGKDGARRIPMLRSAAVSLNISLSCDLNNTIEGENVRLSPSVHTVCLWYLVILLSGDSIIIPGTFLLNWDSTHDDRHAQNH